MHTLIYKVKLNTPEGRASFKEAGAYIRQGELVAFPTETVYGLGADALQPAAVAKIFTAKGRPNDNPLISHIASPDMGENLAEFTPLARCLAQQYWPGPLTMVLPCKPIVPDIVTAGLDTVALRWPSHPVAAALIREAGTPIAAPSANLSGRPSPTTAGHVLEDMQGKIPLILDGGPVDIGLESTVVDARGTYPVLLRPGKITAEELASLCGDCLFPQAGDTQHPASPGMKYRHYAPRGRVYLAKDVREARLIAVRLGQSPLFLVSEEMARELQASGVSQDRIRPLFNRSDLGPYAHNLFASLRDADGAGEAHIVVEEVAEVGIGRAIMNRLKKAAAR